MSLNALPCQRRTLQRPCSVRSRTLSALPPAASLPAASAYLAPAGDRQLGAAGEPAARRTLPRRAGPRGRGAPRRLVRPLLRQPRRPAEGLHLPRQALQLRPQAPVLLLQLRDGVRQGAGEAEHLLHLPAYPLLEHLDVHLDLLDGAPQRVLVAPQGLADRLRLPAAQILHLAGHGVRGPQPARGGGGARDPPAAGARPPPLLPRRAPAASRQP